MHFVEEHVSSFISSCKIIIKNLSVSEKLNIIEEVLHLDLENFMLDLFVKNGLDRFTDFLQFETFLELPFDFLTEILFDTFSDIESVYLFEKGQSHFIDAANDSDSHTLGHFSTTWKVALTSWIMLLT